MFEDKWQEKQDFILPGQVTCTPKRIEGVRVGNMTHPPPPGYSDMDIRGGPSRKRKSVGSTESTSECSVPRKSSLQEGSSHLGLHGQVNNYEVDLNQPNSVGPVNFRHQFDNQLHYQNDFSNVHGNGNKKIGNASYNVPSHFQPNPLFPLVKKMPIGETQTVLNQQSQARNVFSQSEAHRSSPYLKSYNADTETSQVSFNVQDLTRFLSNNHVSSMKIPLEMGSSECMKLVEFLQQSSNQPNRFFDGLNEKACSQEEYSCGSKESGFCSKIEGIDNLPHVATTSLGPSVCPEQDEKSRALQNGGQFEGAPLGICFGNKSERKDGSHGDGSIKLKEMTATPDTEKPKVALTEENSSDYKDTRDKIVGHGQKNDLGHGPANLNERNKLPSEKAARIVAEKLWDGSLQLSSSVTLSAVAFFKSGEKLHGNNWAEFVEVKGKVRLEAFEKYIQDLPRSRNRGLMVISLCWKEGSPEAGLTGMKEVAKGYRRGDRVGYAQLSPGIDLYICPRSDTIITILAKYGFFKGMAVIDDNQDSLIGCVVWRKNQTSNSVGKKMDSKSSSSSGQPLNSPTSVSIQQGAEKKFSPTKIAKDSSQPTTNLENADENGTERKNCESGEVDHKIGNSSSDANSLPIPSVPSNSSYSAMEQLTPSDCYSPIHNPLSCNPCNLMKQMTPIEDDDLPEFDFGIACGISATPMRHPLNPNKSGSLPIISQGSDNTNLAQLPPPPNLGIPPLKKFSESQILVFPVSEEKPGVSRYPSKGSFEESLKKAKLFDDDDDDMPEWCPPEITSNPLTKNPSGSSNTNFVKLPPPPPRPPIPPPSPADTRSAFSYQPFRPGFPPPQPLPFRSGSSSSVGLNSNPAMRPQFSSSNNVPFPFPDGRGRRP